MICFQAFEEIHVYVVVNLLSQVIFIFPLFQLHHYHYQLHFNFIIPQNKRKTKIT